MLELRTWVALFVLYGCSGVVIAENGIELADVLGTTAPSYENGVLIIPRVDTPEQVGRYQDAIFQFDPQSNTWAYSMLHRRNIMRRESGRLTCVLLTTLFQYRFFFK